MLDQAVFLVLWFPHPLPPRQAADSPRLVEGPQMLGDEDLSRQTSKREISNSDVWSPLFVTCQDRSFHGCWFLFRLMLGAQHLSVCSNNIIVVTVSLLTSAPSESRGNYAPNWLLVIVITKASWHWWSTPVKNIMFALSVAVLKFNCIAAISVGGRKRTVRSKLLSYRFCSNLCNVIISREIGHRWSQPPLLQENIRLLWRFRITCDFVATFYASAI